MKKIFKSLLCATVVSVSMLQSCSAFFLGSDKYTKEEYEKAGIKWEHNTILLDNYYFNGKNISQSMAEDITAFYYKNKEKIKTIGEDFYMDSMEFVIKTSEKKDKQINQLERKYRKLWFENIDLRNEITKLKEKINLLKNK